MFVTPTGFDKVALLWQQFCEIDGVICCVGKTVFETFHTYQQQIMFAFACFCIMIEPGAISTI